MRFRPQHIAFVAYTAFFAVLAAFVFWGTWSCDFAPVMPDSPIVYAADDFARFWRLWATDGRFIPNNLNLFLGSPYFWQEFNYVLPAYLSGLALAYFLRGRGLSLFAAYGGGLFLSLCGYWFTLFSAGHGSWFMLMTYCVWPFGLMDRAIRRNKLKNWLLLGATVGWSCYWQPDVFLTFAIAWAVYFVYACGRERKFPAWTGLLAAGLALMVVGSAGILRAFKMDIGQRAKQIASGDTLSKNVQEAGDAYARWVFVTNWSLPSDELAEFFIPRLNGDTSDPLALAIGRQKGLDLKPYMGALGRPIDAPRGNYRQHSLYVGWMTCLLALFAFVSGVFGFAGLKARRKDVVFLAALAFLFCLISLGRYCAPVYRVIFALPLGDMMRCPVKWHHVTELCLCALAGFGLEAVRSLLVRSGGPLTRFTGWMLVALIAIGGIDLAVQAKRFCVPVDVSVARRTGLKMDFAYLSTKDFQNPQVADLVKSGRIVAYAQPQPGVYLVGVHHPWERQELPKNGSPLLPALNVLAVLGTVSLVVYGCRRS